MWHMGTKMSPLSYQSALADNMALLSLRVRAKSESTFKSAMRKVPERANELDAPSELNRTNRTNEPNRTNEHSPKPGAFQQADSLARVKIIARHIRICLQLSIHRSHVDTTLQLSDQHGEADISLFHAPRRILQSLLLLTNNFCHLHRVMSCQRVIGQL